MGHDKNICKLAYGIASSEGRGNAFGELTWGNGICNQLEDIELCGVGKGPCSACTQILKGSTIINIVVEKTHRMLSLSGQSIEYKSRDIMLELWTKLIKPQLENHVQLCLLHCSKM